MATSLIRDFKVNTLPLIGVPNSRYYLKVAPGDKYIEYLTDNLGNFLSPTLPVTPTVYEEVNEELIGVINGINNSFTTSFNFDPDTTIVFINGVKQKKPLHYNTVGFNTVTFSDSPLVGDILEINYVKI